MARSRIFVASLVSPVLQPLNLPQTHPHTVARRCLFELYTAITEQIKIDIILTGEEHASFADAMSAEGYAVIDAALAKVNAQNATASVPADVEAIQALVRSMPGQFDALNNTVKAHVRVGLCHSPPLLAVEETFLTETCPQLHRWFEDNGAIKSARRVSTLTKLSARSRAQSTNSLNSREDTFAEVPNATEVVYDEIHPTDPNSGSGYLDVSAFPEEIEFGFE